MTNRDIIQKQERMEGMKKRLLIAALAICMSVSAAGCGKGGQETGKSSAAVSGVNEFPITQEKTTLEIFTTEPTGVADIEENAFTKWYEEKTNIQLKFDIAKGDVRQAINLKIASNDYGDIFYGFCLSRSEQVSYYNQGVFIDMTDLVNNHSYYIKNMLEERPDIKEQMLHTDNKILGLRNIYEDFAQENPYVMWVYKPWMDKLGLSMPETTEDFYQMLKAFKEKDPNGNGIADEVPLAGRNMWANATALDTYLLDPFVFQCSYGVYNENGKAVFAWDKPEFKEGIRFMKKLYQEGLMHMDSFIMDRARVVALGENEIPILGCAPGKWTSQFTAGGSSKRAEEYVALPPLKGPNGLRQTPYISIDAGCSDFNITSTCKNPEAAIKWADWLYSDEAYLKARAAAGTREAKEGELGLDGTQALYAVDPVEALPTGQIQNEIWGNFALGYVPVEHTYKVAFNTDMKKTNENAYNAYNLYQNYSIKKNLDDIAVPAEECDEYLDLRTAITNEVQAALTSFVIGERSLDDEWEAYLEELKNLNVDRYVEIFQNYLDSLK